MSAVQLVTLMQPSEILYLTSSHILNVHIVFRVICVSVKYGCELLTTVCVDKLQTIFRESSENGQMKNK